MEKTMTPEVKVAQNIIDELTHVVATGTAILKTERGSLFTSVDVPAACIRLNTPIEEHLAFLSTLPTNGATYKIIPMNGEAFDIAIIGRVELKDGATLVDGAEMVLL